MLEQENGRRYLGIDPGLNGAVAVLPDELVFDTPVAAVEGSKTKQVYLPREMVQILIPYTDNATVMLELAHAMPKQGVTSTFSFGLGFGLWQGILAALEIPYELVPPQRWKNALMHGMGKKKEAARVKAQQLWPGIADQLTLKRHHGRADALLLAEYGRRRG